MVIDDTLAPIDSSFYFDVFLMAESLFLPSGILADEMGLGKVSII
jgi:hypothetical protein